MSLSIRIYKTDDPKKWQLDISDGWEVNADGRRKLRRVREHIEGDAFAAEEARRDYGKMARDGADVVAHLRAKKAQKILAAPPTHPTLRAALTAWITSQRGRQGASIRVGTMKDYKSAVGTWLFPHKLADGRLVGDVQVHHVTRAMLQAVLDHVRAEGKSWSCAKQVCDPLKTLYAKLLKDGVVTINPTDGLERGSKPESRVEVFSDADQGAILTAAERTSTSVHAFTLTGMHGGLRWSEINGLQRGDVDFSAHTLSVLRQWDRYAHAAGPLKTKRARRTVPMSPQLEAALKAHIQRCEIARPTAWLFTTSSGRPTDASTFRRQVWRPLLKRAGVDTAKTFHVTRHTAATTMLKRGIPLHVVSRILGHANVGVTDSTYSHIVPTDFTAAIVQAFAVKGATQE